MKKKPDLAHRLTDKELSALEQRIAAEYKKAADELQVKINDYFQKLKKRDAEQKKLIGTIVNGKLYTEQDFKQWRLAQIGRGKRFEALRDRVAERVTKSAEVAIAYVNDTTPGIYSLNRNFSAYKIEQQLGADVGFNLWDEQTARRMIMEQPDLMPTTPPIWTVNQKKTFEYGKKQITSTVTTAILQGESVKGIAERLQKSFLGHYDRRGKWIPGNDVTSSIRAARTAITGAQNAGRMDTYYQAEEMGIRLQKSWMATLDGRTRHTHRELDGQTVDIDKPFRVEGYEIMYPGDPNAAPEMLYNCRCTLIADVEGVDTSNALRRDKLGVMPNMTFTQWANTKRGEGLLAADWYAKKDQERE